MRPVELALIQHPVEIALIQHPVELALFQLLSLVESVVDLQSFVVFSDTPEAWFVLFRLCRMYLIYLRIFSVTN